MSWTLHWLVDSASGAKLSRQQQSATRQQHVKRPPVTVWKLLSVLLPQRQIVRLPYNALPMMHVCAHNNVMTHWWPICLPPELPPK